MAFPDDITPADAARYIEAHGVEVRTECLPYQAAAIRAWLGY